MFPLASVAVHLTVVTPAANVEPLGGSLTTLVTAQLSLAATSQVTLLALHWPVSALTTSSSGR